MNKYGTIITDIGAAALANAAALGTTIEIGMVAVGDGGGTYYQPQPSQTALRRKVWEGKPSSVEIDAVSPNVVVIKAIVPPGVGGWTMREVGIYTVNSQLIAIANMPDHEKVISSGGTSSEFHLRLELAVSHADKIEITIDPYLILATKNDILNHNKSKDAHPDIRALINPDSILKDAQKYTDTALTNHSENTQAHKDIRDEIAAALENTTTVDNRITDHNIASDAHEDIRESINAGFTEHDEKLSTHDQSELSHDDIRLKLAALEAALNAKPATTTPIGTVTQFAGSTTPTGWLLCNGQAVSRTEYSALFSVIGARFGSGNSATFNLPDFTGRVPGGVGGSLGALGASGGAATHKLSISEMPQHKHTIALIAASGPDLLVTYPGYAAIIPPADGSAVSPFATLDWRSALSNTYATCSTEGVGNSHNNLQPYLTINFIIYAGV